jgi:SAM-dependent methyltransferase
MPDWKQAWEESRTPWDAGEPSPTLLRLLDEDRVPSGAILVPGCGTGYDLAVLAREDRHVVGLDLSPIAREAFLIRYPSLPGNVRYEVGDFFQYAADEAFDFIWDYTFFCALDPRQRGAWGETMKRLLKPRGILATLLFPYAKPIPEEQGPPWPINELLVAEALGDGFERTDLEKAEASHRGREDREYLAIWQKGTGGRGAGH